MPDRIKKVNEVLRKELNRIIFKEVDLPKDVLVTLTDVETSRDLDHTKVFVSVIPEKESEVVLHILNKATSSLHQVLNKKLFIKRVPKLQFAKDSKLSSTQKIDEILDSLKGR